jgi:hypothetical protein
MNTFPKVKDVKPLHDKKLLITFQNDIQKIYDCSSLLSEKHFSFLADDSLFKLVKTDLGGYGISWNNEVDLSESELWMHGVSPEQVH